MPPTPEELAAVKAQLEEAVTDAFRWGLAVAMHTIAPYHPYQPALIDHILTALRRKSLQAIDDRRTP